MYVEINGKDYYIKFNQYALEAFSKMLDWDGEVITSIYATVWAGLKGGAFVKQEDLDLTFEQVVDWVDKKTDEDHQLIAKICNTWSDTFIYKKWIKQVKEAVEKKTLMSTGSESTK